MNPSIAAISLALCIAAANPCAAQDSSVMPAASAPRLTFDEATIRRAFEGTTRDPIAAVTGTRSQQSGTRDWAAEGRACDGCPHRSAIKAYLTSAIVNVFYNLGNKARGEATANIGFNSWAANLKFGFEWDDNPFTTNQFGHPYQGSNYYTGGRANGLSYWESAALTAFGSATWEYFGENNYASFNDLVNTTLGGIALGEMFHRVAWLIRDTTASGKSRLFQEIAATAVDPVGGAIRFTSGDASRISEKPKQFVPAAHESLGSFGVLWQGDNDGAFTGSPKAYLEMDLRYGNMASGRSREPFEAFSVDFRLGGGAGISDIRVRGRLLGQPLGSVQLTVAQSYDYTTNQAYDFGRQGFDVALSGTKHLGSRLEAALIGGAGVTVLGAIDRVDLVQTLSEEADERTYDYGPGTSFGGGVRFLFDKRMIANFFYQGYQLYVVDGVRANHVVQRFRMDLLVPIHGRLAAGASGEFFYRKTYFQAGGEQRDKFPQIRFFMAWR